MRWVCAAARCAYTGVTASARPVQVVVVGYHAPYDLDRCLTSVASEAEVTLVDNSSSGDVRAVALRHGVDYLDPGSNLGFAAGVNVALRKLTGRSPRDVLLLNPDAFLAPSDLRQLTDFLRFKGNERVAAVSPRLVDDGGRAQRVVWPFPTPGRAWAEALGLGLIPARRTFVIGAVLLLRWEALLEVGLFDERFFLYAEEADWQKRAISLGWSSKLCSDAVASHRGAGTSMDSSNREALFHSAHETYIRKWHGRWGWMVYRSAACLGATARALLLRGDRRTAAARRARLYFRGPRRCAALVRN
jgi:GT2 family glycosyltransferase